MLPSTVTVRHTSPQTLRQDVKALLAETGLPSLDRGNPVFIKINGNFDRDYPGSNSSRWFLEALLKSLTEAGFREIKAIEGDLPYFTASQMIVRTRLKSVLDAYGIPFLPYEGLPRDEYELPRILEGAQLINIPVPHTHGLAVISCATKNFYGLLPKNRRRHHHHLSEKLLELSQRVKAFTIVDGTVGLIGESTRRGMPRCLDLLISGWDPLAIDHVMAEVMGFSPENIPLLKLAMAKKLLSPESVQLAGDFSWETLPRTQCHFAMSLPKRIVMGLEASFLESCAPFRWAETRMERFYHLYSYSRKKKELLDGPWMEYGSFLE